MPNEQIFEQWTAETAAEYFDRTGDYDGTERGDEKHVPDLDEFNDTADHDHFIYEKVSDELYEAAANSLRNMNISLTAAKEVASDAIAKAVAKCERDYAFYAYDELVSYNLDAVLIDYELGII